MDYIAELTEPAPPSLFAAMGPVLVDAVTGLPNRQQLIRDYAGSVTADTTLMMFTLTEPSHFSSLLRALGHDYSEDFLRAGAARILAFAPPDLKLYHVSIMSFTLIYPGDPQSFVSELISSWAPPIICGGLPILTRLGIGLAACLPTQPKHALRNALAAAHDSRRNPNGWARYDSQSDEAHLRSVRLLSDLPAAMSAPDQLFLNYQPKYNLRSGRPIGAEALLRWNHPTLGQVSPMEFVPLAETTALINDLTQWVLRASVEAAKGWESAGLSLNMAVNISPQNLNETGFADSIIQALDRSSLDPQIFELEFTEGQMACDNAIVHGQLKFLRDTGLHIALDDFGTGFSNFRYLTTIPADIIKLDRSFILQVENDPRNAELVRTIIQLAHRLDYLVVAEGIENAAVYDLLKSWDCDEGQGYFMSRPLGSEDFLKAMKAA
jgi:EAL domain-containing protein (putative c-di-GMP-specific phosphodiesterase class I)